ncbi:MAG: hypoxanthine phosphoribosyltransferase [Nitrospinae bacterium]|nr:hypoxanthine phosphoribosyltransferase [Nitrospinota bacterium]MBI5750343.1 hypoxanthine phosphoribosyltransferase [Nitrospinota bacterium]
MYQKLDILITEESIRRRVKELGEKISSDYRGREILAIGILKGAWIFMSDLVRNIKIPVMCDFIGVSSYGDGAVSSERVKLISDIRIPVNGKDVLLIDDIIDTGFSIKFVKYYLESKNPASIKLCVLLDKQSRRKVDIHADYAGFTIPDRFVVGYGLDYAEKYRNLPYIAAVK